MVHSEKQRPIPRSSFLTNNGVAIQQQRASRNELLCHSSKSLLVRSDSRPVKANIVEVHRARAAGRHTAFATQANRDLIHVGQIDSLVGKIL